MSRTLLVTRHPGALEWLQRCGWQGEWVRLELETLCPGDRVVGTLSIPLAAALAERGVDYLHLSLRVPAEWRGRELSADQLEQCDAHLEVFRIQRLKP